MIILVPLSFDRVFFESGHPCLNYRKNSDMRRNFKNFCFLSSDLQMGTLRFPEHQ